MRHEIICSRPTTCFDIFLVGMRRTVNITVGVIGFWEGNRTRTTQPLNNNIALTPPPWTQSLCLEFKTWDVRYRRLSVSFFDKDQRIQQLLCEHFIDIRKFKDAVMKCINIVYNFNHRTYMFQSTWPSSGCSQSTSVLLRAKSNTYVFTIWCKNRVGGDWLPCSAHTNTQGT